MEPQRDHETAPAEHEPQVGDVAAAAEYIIKEMAAVVEGEELHDLLEAIRDAVDLEEAMGIAAGAFVQAGIDYDAGLARLGEILHVEEIRSNGDQPTVANVAAALNRTDDWR
jgi:hypothetical protein